MKPAKSDITLSIGEVSRILSVSTGVIRAWEREALIVPDRTDGGHRIYRNQHLRRLRRIARLYFVDKLNPAAIRRELGVATKSAQASYLDTSLGAKLREIRKKKGQTLAQTAKRSKLSVSFISALERGNTGVTLETLFRLTEALGTTIPTLRGGDVADSASRHYVKADERQRFETEDKKIMMEDLIPKPAGMEAQITTISVGTESDGEYSHKGQEFLMVMEGQLSVWLEPDEYYELKKGDVLYLHSHLKHKWRNGGPKRTKVLWVNADLPAGARAGVSASPLTDDVPSEPFASIVAK